MLVPMSSTNTEVVPQQGFCFHCGSTVEGDIMEHCAQEHARVSAKPRVAIKSWQNRLDDIVEAIKEIRQESDIAVQVQQLDKEVIQELYLVRASLTQTKRNTAQRKG
jgi:maltose-binding protein MalE